MAVLKIDPQWAIPASRLLLSLTLFLFCSRPATAALGETEAQLAARYPTAQVLKSQDPDTHYLEITYFMKDLRVIVTFVDGKSANEYYDRGPGKLTGKEINDFLALNTLGGTWKETQYKVKEEVRKWWLVKGDHTVGVAVLQSDGEVLEISTKEFDDEETVRIMRKLHPDFDKILQQSGTDNH